jgi:hypothetical protein
MRQMNTYNVVRSISIVGGRAGYHQYHPVPKPGDLGSRSHLTPELRVTDARSAFIRGARQEVSSCSLSTGYLDGLASVASRPHES